MTPQKKSLIPAEKVALYEKAVATLPGVERKGAANPYTAVNGNMFSLFSAVTQSLALRLPNEEREAFLKKHKSKLFEVYGAVMKEYVTVPDALLKNTKELRKYMAVSYEYAKTLKPKASRKK
jgi:TfoX/Sxy family transcriptional regulator of competence genes